MMVNLPKWMKKKRTKTLSGKIKYFRTFVVWLLKRKAQIINIMVRASSSVCVVRVGGIYFNNSLLYNHYKFVWTCIVACSVSHCVALPHKTKDYFCCEKSWNISHGMVPLSVLFLLKRILPFSNKFFRFIIDWKQFNFPLQRHNLNLWI